VVAGQEREARLPVEAALAQLRAQLDEFKRTADSLKQVKLEGGLLAYNPVVFWAVRSLVRHQHAAVLLTFRGALLHRQALRESTAKAPAEALLRQLKRELSRFQGRLPAYASRDRLLRTVREHQVGKPLPPSAIGCG
jgi:hypothetical protein